MRVKKGEKPAAFNNLKGVAIGRQKVLKVVKRVREEEGSTERGT